MSFPAGLALACFATGAALAQAPEGAPAAPPTAAVAPADPAPAPDAAAAAAPAPTPAVDPAPAAPAAADPLADRLLGGSAAPGADPAAAAPAAPTAGLPLAPAWLWAVLIVVAAGLLWLRARITAGPSDGPSLTVVGRTLLGREGNLAVVEVKDGDRTRRMLIGYGGGAPRLVAELADGDTAAPAPGAFGAAMRRAVSAPAPAPAAAPAEAPNLRARDDLIAEVLAERGAGSSAAGAGGDPRVGAPESAADDDDSAETYTFRGLLG